MANELWLTPLVLMPGVALLIVSTSARYGQLHGELHHIEHHGCNPLRQAQRLFRRARMFRNALVALYATIAWLVLASLTGGLAVLVEMQADSVVLGLIALGAGFLLYASALLVKESMLSLEIIRDHVDAMAGKDARDAVSAPAPQAADSH